MLKSTLPSNEGVDWFERWRGSPEYSAVKNELTRLRQRSGVTNSSRPDHDSASHENEFVVSFWAQLREVFLRVSKHFWRSPVYIWSKLSVTILFVSVQLTLSFHPANHHAVSVYWLQLQSRQQPPRPSKPTLCCLYVSPDFQSFQQTDHAYVCSATGPLRGSGEAF